MAGGRLAERFGKVGTPAELFAVLSDIEPRWTTTAERARSETSETMKRKRSARTVEDYAKHAERAKAAGWDLAKVAHSYKSFATVRAAALVHMAERLAKVLAEGEAVEARELAKGKLAAVAKAAKFIHWDGRRLDGLLDDFRDMKAQKWAERKADAASSLRAKTSKAKALNTAKPSGPKAQRAKLGRLPDDWRERMFLRMAGRQSKTGSGRLVGGKYRDACAVAVLFGLRPAELSKGVELRLKDGKLTARILGAKCKDAAETKELKGRGQKWREITLPASGGDVAPSAYAHLMELARLNAKVSCDGPAFGDAFGAASAVEFKGMKHPPSAYACRHAFSADARASGIAPEVLAKAMGHQATGSQSHYGLPGQGSGRLEGMEAAAESKVRATAKTAADVPKTAAKSRAGQWAKVNAMRKR
jgi:hypothetical protein